MVKQVEPEGATYVANHKLLRFLLLPNPRKLPLNPKKIIGVKKTLFFFSCHFFPHCNFVFLGGSGFATWCYIGNRLQETEPQPNSPQTPYSPHLYYVLWKVLQVWAKLCLAECCRPSLPPQLLKLYVDTRCPNWNVVCLAMPNMCVAARGIVCSGLLGVCMIYTTFRT